jgi:hypothetical protein
MNWLRNLFHQWFTEPDNTTFCIMKALVVAISSSGIWLQIHDVVIKGHAFIFQDFCTGAGILFAGAGAALALKPNSPTDITQKKD